MARERYEDEEDDRDRDEGPSRGRGDDDDYDDRPSRRSGELTGMDKFMNNMGLAIGLAIFSFCCCPLLGIIMGIVGMITCKNPDSKRNSIIVLVAGVVGAAVGVVLQLSGQLNQLNK